MPERASKNLRSDFATWMRTRLGCQSVEVGIPVPLGADSQPFLLDLQGERYARQWRQMKSVGLVSFATVIVLANIPDWSSRLSPMLNLVLVLSLLFLLISFLGRMATHQYILVRCRNLERPATRSDLRGLHDAVARVGGSKARKWKRAEVIFVAGKPGFDDDALAFASAVAIRCYRRTKAGFRHCAASASAVPLSSPPSQRRAG